MGLLSSLTTWWSNGSTGGISAADSQANYTRQSLLLAGQLQARLAAGTISEKAYSDGMTAIQNAMPDQSAEAWNSFLADVEANAAALPAEIATGAADVGAYVGSTAAGIVGATASGAASGLLSKINWQLWLFIIGGGLLLWWLFTSKNSPIKGAKISAIPLPV